MTFNNTGLVLVFCTIFAVSTVFGATMVSSVRLCDFVLNYDMGIHKIFQSTVGYFSLGDTDVILRN